MKKLIAYSVDIKRCAKQVVHEALDEILKGNFSVPTFDETKAFLRDVIVHSFDDYGERKKVVAKHPSWDDDQVKDEIHRLKIRYDKEYHGNLRQAASETIAEIENLISSLNGAIKAWKIKNLE